MMTDRELLELAAKAAGLTIECDADSAVVFPSHYSGGFSIINERGGSTLWNPLTDDGDALRLAVKLGMEIYVDDNPEGRACTEAQSLTHGGRRVAINHDAAPQAATRRAIVRAAAEIWG
jgi:hypothetical protein